MSSVRAILSEPYAGEMYRDDGEVGGGFFVGCHFGDLQFTFYGVTGI